MLHIHCHSWHDQVYTTTAWPHAMIWIATRPVQHDQTCRKWHDQSWTTETKPTSQIQQHATRPVQGFHVTSSSCNLTSCTVSQSSCPSPPPPPPFPLPIYAVWPMSDIALGINLSDNLKILKLQTVFILTTHSQGPSSTKFTMKRTLPSFHEPKQRC